MISVEEVGAARVEEAVAETLQALQSDRTLGRSHRHADLQLGFDIDRATDLRPATPGENHSGRSESPVIWRGNHLGTLTVTALAPGQGTGAYDCKDPEAQKLSEASRGRVPRSRHDIPYEVHLPLVSFGLSYSGIRQRNLLGHASLIGMSERGLPDSWNAYRMICLGAIGQPETVFKRIMANRDPSPVQPDFTMTTGYQNKERLGEQTAVVNRTEALQVVGAIAIDAESDMMTHRPLLARAHRPHLVC